MPRFLLLVFTLLTALSASARVRASRSVLDAPRRILFVAAHPDDETVIAPYLYDRCVAGGAECTMLIMTAGEGGQCALPSGCGPDLGIVRTGEMVRSAALLNLRLIQWHYPDVFDADERWSREAGGKDALVALLHDTIAAIGADTVITFDPGHGTTGHPAHRTIAALVLASTPAWQIETRAAFEGDNFTFSTDHPDQTSAFVAGASWNALVRTAETHASQFNPIQIESLRRIPQEQRMVWFRTR